MYLESVFMAIAALPIAIFLVLSAAVKLPLARASFCSLCVAVLSALFCFGFKWDGILWELQRGGRNAFTIFLVVLSAMFLYEILERAGMFERIRQTIEAYVEDDTLQVFFVAWVFTSFLQSVTGFGVPVAVAAPILVRIGIKPVKAVSLAILGHGWGGTFGTLALAWQGLLLQLPEQAAVEVGKLAWYSGVLLWALNLLCGLAVLLVYKGRNLRSRDLAAVFMISLCQGGGQLVFAQINPAMACFAGSLLAVVGFFVVKKGLYDGKASNQQEKAAGAKDGIDLILFPFLCLTALVLLPFISQSFSILMLTSLVTCGYYGWRKVIGSGVVLPAFFTALQKSGKAIVPILFLVSMSKVMEGSGQIDVLAAGIAGVSGVCYGFFAPFVGILGAFISSSNMSSNIVFGGFQYKVSQLVGGSSEWILAAQTAGGSAGILVAAGNFVLGLATTGESGKEGEVMRKLLPFCLAAGVVLGSVTFMLYM